MKLNLELFNVKNKYLRVVILTGLIVIPITTTVTFMITKKIMQKKIDKSNTDKNTNTKEQNDGK